jgi:diguanylate cyclase (GGDEF)-like protein
VRWTPEGSREVRIPAEVAGRWDDVAETPDGSLWIATREGLYRVAAGQVRRFDTTNGLPHNCCLALADARDGSVWVATLGGGLARVRNSVERVLATPDGLATDRLVDVEVADDGAVWTCGFGGVSRVVPGGIMSFTAAELPELANAFCVQPIDTQAYVFAGGLAEVNVTGRSARLVFSGDDPAVDICSASFHSSLAVTPGGDVLLGSDVNGSLLCWHPAEGSADGRSRDRRCRIVRLTLDGKDMDLRWPIPPLNSGWSRLRFDFTAASLLREDATQFIYRMDGYDPGWSTPSSRSSVEYTQVGHGSRHFLVRARFDDGSWSDPARLTFTVTPPWWSSRILLVVVILTAGFGIWGLIWLRTRSLRRQQRRLEELVVERTRELETLNSRLQQLSTTDQLTGLANRHSFAETIDTLAALVERSIHPETRSPQEERLVLLFAMVDLDRFKEVNDRCGHAEGDQVLQRVARCLRTTVREADLVFRWGGDEFLVVALQRLVEPMAVLPDRLLAALRKEVHSTCNQKVMLPTCSIGFCRYPLDVHTVRLGSWLDSLKLADAALLLAKQRGRNRAVGILDGHFIVSAMTGVADLEMAAAEGEIEILQLI